MLIINVFKDPRTARCWTILFLFFVTCQIIRVVFIRVHAVVSLCVSLIIIWF
jgi:hypothetical protein